MGARRRPARRPGAGLRAAQLYPDGRTGPWSAPHGGEPGRRARESPTHGGDDPRAHQPSARRAAARPAVQLGAGGVGRAHLAHARDPVRLAARGSASADVLVRRHGLSRRYARRPGPFGGRALCRAAEDGRCDEGAVGRARRRQRAALRSDFDAGPLGCNDTTRNSMSGGVWGLSQFPEQYQKLRQNPELVPSLVSEIIRWHTPVLHLRRTALADFELGGKTIRKGDKVAMWFVSGNRDEDAIKDPHDLIVDRPRAREHISFGFGVHRCVGNRLAELQLRILWEEILKRDLEIEVMDRPIYLRSNLIHGVRELPVQIH